MKKITNGKKPFLAVPVPKKSYDYYFTCYSLILMVHFDDDGVNNGHGYESEREIDLFSEPKCGTILGKLSELTEEQADNLVHETYFDGIGYPHKDYLRHKYDLYSAKASLHSLFQSNDCWLKEWVSSNVCDFCQFEKRSVSCTSTGVDSGCEGIGCDLANDIYNEKISKASEDFLIILID